MQSVESVASPSKEMTMVALGILKEGHVIGSKELCDFFFL